MKKFFALIITLSYILTSNICFAENGLYLLKNTSKTTVSKCIEPILVQNNYTIQKKLPFYAISNKNPESYAYITFEPYGNNLLYFYETNKDKRLNKKILKTFDTMNITYEKSYNQVSINMLSEIAQRTISGEVTSYSFEEPTSAYQKKETRTVTNQSSLSGYVSKVARGATLNVYLQNPINTATANVGDSVIGILKEDWLINNTHVIAQQGSVLYGTLTKASPAKMGMRNGSVQIDFNRLDTPDGQTYNITTEKIDFDVTNEGKLKSTVTNVAATAAVGALVGLAFALLANGNYATSAAIGAGVGSGVALATQVAQRGVDAEIPSYTELEVVLDSDLSVIIY